MYCIFSVESVSVFVFDCWELEVYFLLQNQVHVEKVSLILSEPL